MSDLVVDASALLAVVYGEAGADVVDPALHDAAMSSINLSEVVAKLASDDIPGEEIRRLLAPYELIIVPFDEGQAYEAGLLRSSTSRAGLSLGDRACLALGRSLGLPVLTGDRAWGSLDLGVDVRVFR